MSIQGIGSAIRELDRSIFDYPREFRTDRGKFIRIGGLVVVGPYKPGSSQLFHANLLDTAQKGPLGDRYFEEWLAPDRQSARPAPSLKHPGLVDDAGYFHVGGRIEPYDDDFYGLIPDDAPITGHVRVTGFSTGYGHADLAGRHHTRGTFSLILGRDVEVIADLSTE